MSHIYFLYFLSNPYKLILKISIDLLIETSFMMMKIIFIIFFFARLNDG